MAKIVVNENLRVNGKLTFERTINENGTGFIIEGVFATHLYFDDISSLDSARFSLKGVEIQKEVFASDDYNVLYYFTAKEIEVFGSEFNGAYYILHGKEMKMIEDEMYKNEHPVLGDIGEKYKDMVIEDKEDDESEEEEN